MPIAGDDPSGADSGLELHDLGLMMPCVVSVLAKVLLDGS